MDKLLPCPFCGKKPSVVQRPDSLDGYFCAIACFCGGYSATAHQFATDKERANAAYDKAKELWNRRSQPENKPLTLDELREMDGEPQPVYLVSDKYAEGNGWKVCHGVTDNGLVDFGDEAWAVRVFEDRHVIAYRNKPEEVHG